MGWASSRWDGLLQERNGDLEHAAVVAGSRVIDVHVVRQLKGF